MRLGATRPVPANIREEAVALLSGFLKSENGAMLRRADILGREVSLLADVLGRSVSARADIIFRVDDRIRIGDYKLSLSSTPSIEVTETYIAAGEAALGPGCTFEVLPLEVSTAAR